MKMKAPFLPPMSLGLRCLKNVGTTRIESSLLYSTTTAQKYDLVVIGGGSGGLACAKEAAGYGAKVAVLDYVTPSPHGTVWGLGGTCVNVGCIPKKLMHQAALLGKSVKDAAAFGWSVPPAELQLNWHQLVTAVTNHVGSLNWGHRVALRDKRVTYLNASGTMLDRHTVLAKDRKDVETVLQTDNVVLATGGRPRYPTFAGAELAITSDDLFRLRQPPGRTLCVGGSYVSLECAGFLTGLGFDTSVLLRSIPLRGFDQQMAGLVVSAMENLGTRVVRGSEPLRLERTAAGRLRVSLTPSGDGQPPDEEYDTVLLAVGRDPDTRRLGLDALGVTTDRRSGKIVTDPGNRTSVDNIYAIGDIVQGAPELTPTAIVSGRLLADRLYGGSSQLLDLATVPTTVFTPLEYSCVGLSEESAAEMVGGDDQLEVYHAFYRPLEFIIPGRDTSSCYIKAVCERREPQRVLGLHFIGPNAGEVLQGFAVAMRHGMTMESLRQAIGIHPTSAEEVVKLNISKRSGRDPTVTGC
ncbi:Thioredoxin reductase 2, mitochondrial [Amphibalanus amphitrite]|uniref:Thioredoxin reductase 2, mitochondrial n=1 Tax=Amphibalanus amphitrite TaxID=1232801 RepID=A0A6A4W1D3_AMPAM|nr:Thioredoxin reductase 2, mitochondrial [Amphibalanus amphitrite]